MTSHYSKDYLGVLTLGFGKQKYVEQAICMAKTLNRHMPDLPIAIVSDRDFVSDVFSHHIKLDNSHGIGTIQKIQLDKYTPFQRTLFIDSDCLITRPFPDELKEIQSYSFTPIVERFFGVQDRDYFFVDLGETLKKLEISRFPKYNGGVYYFDNSQTAKDVFELSREFANRYKELGLKFFDGGGPGDETVIGLALEKLGITSLYNDRTRLMRAVMKIEGKLYIDVLDGSGCHFTIGGEEVNPAICHFSGHDTLRYEYKLGCFLIQKGDKKVTFLRNILLRLIGLRFYTTNFYLNTKYKFKSFLKRIGVKKLLEKLSLLPS